MNPNRRQVVATYAAIAAGCAGTAALITRRPKPRPLARSRVAILSAHTYSGDLDSLVYEGLKLFGQDFRGKSVLLKPNLVEWRRGVAINTNPLLVGAAAEAFLRLGAATVKVAEGPGHQRDTDLLLWESGFAMHLKDRGIDFIDLNRDELVKTKLRTDYSGLRELWLPKTVLATDVVVSMPKVKTHHWAGVTLSMKNMFGIVPGTRYGWPKNPLHWAGIHESILDICATVPSQFVIVDGIIAMEGNGPLHGAARDLGKVIMADDPVAADATCMRLMGLSPGRVHHVAEAGRFLGNAAGTQIEQLTERLPLRATAFAILPEFDDLVVPSDH